MLSQAAWSRDILQLLLIPRWKTTEKAIIYQLLNKFTAFIET